MSTPTIKYEKMTAKTAATICAAADKARSNFRKASPNRISGYAAVMEAGDWDEHNGETIKFDKNGRLFDGRHRLGAQAVADLTLTWAVARNIDEVNAVGTGKARVLAQYLQAKGQQDPNSMAHAIKMLMASERDWDYSLIRAPGINAEVDYFKKHKRELGRAFEYVPWTTHYLGSRGLQYAMYVLFQRIHKGDGDAFFDDLYEPGNLPVRDPVIALRTWLMRAKQRPGRPSKRAQIGIWLKAWNLRRSDQDAPARFRFLVSGRQAEELPELV